MNYKKVNNKFVCKITRSLTLMFAAILASALAACSDDKPVAGGSAEETGIYALENITVAGRSLSLSVSAQFVGKGEKEQLAFVSGSAYAEGAQVKLFEVDTASFEVSEEPFTQTTSDKEGNFEMEKVSPESPYAVVEVTGKIAAAAKNPYGRVGIIGWEDDARQATYRAAVDLRETKDVKVNILTTLAASRTLSLAKTGLSFAEAKVQAEKDVLLALGIRDSLAAFDEVSYSQKSSSIFPVFIMAGYLFGGYSDAVDLAAADIAENGTWSALTYERNLDAKGTERDFHLLREMDFLALLGLGLGDIRVAELAEKYFFNVVGVIPMRKGLCTDDREGEKNDFGSFNEFVCESGYWVLHEKKSVYQKTLGTMTDERDGKTYKTFTVEYDGESRTWLAENLNYTVDNSWCYNDEPANCEKYGRLYSTWAAFDIPRDTQYIAANLANDSAWYFEVEDAEEYANAYDTAYDHLVDVLDSADGQGVCPEGWRIPTPDDWGHLISVIYEVDKNANIPAALKSKTWTMGMDGLDVVGFNMLPSGFADRRILPSWAIADGYLEEFFPEDGFTRTNGFMDYDLGNSACYVLYGKNGATEIRSTNAMFEVGFLVPCFDVSNDGKMRVAQTEPEYGHPVRCVKN